VINQSFLDQPFLLKGTIDISDYYNWEYQRAEQTHYALKLAMAPEGVVLHTWNAEKQADFASNWYLLAVRLRACLTVVLLSGSYDARAGELLLELLDYSLEQ
jgi:hypothetical protein